jgi:mono/diheme cytochrome c family protein/uncharacterized membrane protein
MLQTEFIGRLHPLIVHLPIGILLFAFAMMVYQRLRGLEGDALISFALLSGAISAGVACVAGWILAQSGEYDAALVFKHQWTGIFTAGLGFLAFFLKRFRWALMAATVVVLSIAGHYGGVLTHGEDYLFPKKKATIAQNTPNLDSLQNTLNQGDATAMTVAGTVSDTPRTIERKSFVYRDFVVPILENKCYKCHSATKMKGGLRLDTEAFIGKGGENGSVLTAGNPENSKLFTSLLLPLDDNHHMPPKGKPQLSEQEIAAIHFWIKKGASFQELIEIIQVGGASQSTAMTIPKLKFSTLPKNSSNDSLNIAAISSSSAVNRVGVDAEAKILSTPTEPAAPASLEKLKQDNIIISDFGQGSNYLMANFVNVKTYTSTLLDDLNGVKNQLLRLRLSNQPVRDADLKNLAVFKNLTRLNLEKTSITDAALLYLQQLPNLEQVNLYGTNITDNGLLALTKCTNLKTIYLWQTKVTPTGIEQLKKSMPQLQVELGGFQFSKPDTSKLTKKAL